MQSTMCRPDVYETSTYYVGQARHGAIGSSLGSRRLANQTLRYLVAVVPVIASAKLPFA